MEIKEENPLIFISYSHDSEEHKELVLTLANRLRKEGIDCALDQYTFPGPEKGWPIWMLEQIEAANFILMICTKNYHDSFRKKDTEKGSTWQGAILTQGLYDHSNCNTKIIPVLFQPEDEKFIPTTLRAFPYYCLSIEKDLLQDSESASEGYHNLYRHLTHQPKIQVPQVGTIKKLGPQSDQGSNNSSNPIQDSFSANVETLNQETPKKDQEGKVINNYNIGDNATVVIHSGEGDVDQNNQTTINTSSTSSKTKPQELALHQGEQDFVKEVLGLFGRYDAVLLLAQEGRAETRVLDFLMEKTQFSIPSNSELRTLKITEDTTLNLRVVNWRYPPRR